MADDNRSIWAFLRSIRTFPGFGARLAMAAFFLAALARERGVEFALDTVGATLLIAFSVGYPIWRRLGTRTAR
jgi:hypothetical protein